MSLAIIFFMSAQLVYANATVCENLANCGTMMKTSSSQMQDCPFHSSQNNKEKEKKKNIKQCKCCAVLIFETTVQRSPSIILILSFIEFSFLNKREIGSLFFRLRPPIA